MNTPVPIADLFNIYQSSLGDAERRAKRVYTDALVIWLGIIQTLMSESCRSVLARELDTPRARSLMGECARKQGKLSKGDGGLIQARQEITKETLQEALFALSERTKSNCLWKEYRVVGIDGSTVSLKKSNKELRRAFPGNYNKERKSRWPIVHLVILIDLLEARIISADVGAKYGQDAISEQELSKPLFDIIDDNTILVGDRNFGTFDIAKTLVNQGSKVLLRLSKTAAQYVAGGVPLSDGADIKVNWKCTPEVAKKIWLRPPRWHRRSADSTRISE